MQMGDLILALTALTALAMTAGPAAAQDPTFAKRAAALYASAPDILACRPGVLARGEASKALDTVNAVRALHGLGAVVYDDAAEAQMMQAALILAAKGDLSHEPPPSWRCFTPFGAAGAGLANVRGGVNSPYLGFETTEAIIASWITDVGNMAQGNVGHRRWLLDPFLKSVAFGRVAGPVGAAGFADAAAIKVLPVAPGPALSAPPFIAYPFHDYPGRFWNPQAMLSFGVLVDPANRWANSALDWSGAVITARQRGGGIVAVLDRGSDTKGPGLPNNLQFRLATLELGAAYEVSIKGVVVAGVRKDFEYWFRVAP